MNRADVVRKLRDLRRLERRFHGGPAGSAAEVWERFFSLEPGRRVKYPLMMLVAFDRGSRERAFRDYLLALWAETAGEEARTVAADRELASYLGIGAGASPEEYRRAFRRLALELHPDLGGDEDSMRELLERYRRSSRGGGAGCA
ncbi:MAG: J domain-containing protein [Spirochaetota bacterium]